NQPQAFARQGCGQPALAASLLGSLDVESSDAGSGREDRREEGRAIEPFHRQSNPRPGAFDLATGKGRLGVDRPHPESPALPGTEEAHLLSFPGRGAAALERVAA